MAPSPQATVNGSAPAPSEPYGADSGKTRQHWYGWQSLTIDAASLLVVGAGFAESSPTSYTNDISLVGLGAYLGGGPVVHLIHGSPSRALGSLGLRTGLPLALGGLARATDDGCGNRGEIVCGDTGVVILGVLGMVVAATIDAAWLGHEEIPIEATRVPSVGISLGREHAAIVAGGTF